MPKGGRPHQHAKRSLVGWPTKGRPPWPPCEAGSDADPRARPDRATGAGNREGPDMADVVALRLRREMPDRHVLDHAAAQRADGVLVGAHGVLLSGTGLTPDLQTGPTDPITQPRSCRTTLPRERFSSAARFSRRAAGQQAPDQVVHRTDRFARKRSIVHRKAVAFARIAEGELWCRHSGRRRPRMRFFRGPI